MSIGMAPNLGGGVIISPIGTCGKLDRPTDPFLPIVVCCDKDECTVGPEWAGGKTPLCNGDDGDDPSDSGDAQTVFVNLGGGYILPDLLITCLESGITRWSTCGGATFYGPTGQLRTYSTPGGSCNDCSIFHFPRTVGPGVQAEVVPDTVSIIVV